jgi:putative nucleotidyltransferase with HDIG domain
MIGRDDALTLLQSKLKNNRLVKHSLAVEVIMRRLAERLNENQELWSLTGLLHDVDYEETSSNPKFHGLRSAEMLEGLLPQEALEAIRAHNELTGYSCDSKLSYALAASDQVSGLIVASALVMPSKKLSEVKLSTLRKKLKQKDFARGVNRVKIMKLPEKLGLTLDEFLELSLKALQSISENLGL